MPPPARSRTRSADALDPPRRDRRAVQRARGRHPPHERDARAQRAARRAVAAGIPKIVTASSPTVLGYGAPTGWLPDRFPLDEETAPTAVERLRPVEAPRRADDRDAAAPDRRRDAVRRLPPLLRDRPRGVGGRADPAGPHRARAPRRSRRCRRPPCSTTSTRGMSRPSSTRCSGAPDDIPNAEVFFVGADDALAREPLAELLPRFVPGTDELAAGAHRHRARVLQREGPPRCSAGAPPTTGATELADLADARLDPKGRAGMDFDGILFFPVTPFDADGRVDDDLLREHVSTTLAHAPAASSPRAAPASSTPSRPTEAAHVVRVATETVAGTVPVVAGTGGPLGHATAVARAAADAGADALLVLPPYLVGGPQAGLVAYVEAVAAASALPVVIYHRGTAQYSVDIRAPARAEPARSSASRTASATSASRSRSCARSPRPGRDDFAFFNGLLTAELTQGAYRGIGIPLYSSAAFAMIPEVANAYYRAYVDGDEARRARAARRLLLAARAPARRDARLRRLADQGRAAARRAAGRQRARAAGRPDARAGGAPRRDPRGRARAAVTHRIHVGARRAADPRAAHAAVGGRRHVGRRDRDARRALRRRRGLGLLVDAADRRRGRARAARSTTSPRSPSAATADPSATWRAALAAPPRGRAAAGITTIALAGLDLALWDAAARAARHARCRRCSAVARDSVRAYGSGVNLHYPLDELVAQVRRWVDAGLRRGQDQGRQARPRRGPRPRRGGARGARPRPRAHDRREPALGPRAARRASVDALAAFVAGVDRGAAARRRPLRPRRARQRSRIERRADRGRREPAHRVPVRRVPPRRRRADRAAQHRARRRHHAVPAASRRSPPSTAPRCIRTCCPSCPGSSR